MLGLVGLVGIEEIAVHGITAQVVALNVGKNPLVRCTCPIDEGAIFDALKCTAYQLVGVG